MLKRGDHRLGRRGVEVGGKQTINPMEYTLVVVRYLMCFWINSLLHATCRPVASMMGQGGPCPLSFGRGLTEFLSIA
mgnify:CR=1 FL=1